MVYQLSWMEYIKNASNNIKQTSKNSSPGDPLLVWLSWYSIFRCQKLLPTKNSNDIKWMYQIESTTKWGWHQEHAYAQYHVATHWQNPRNMILSGAAAGNSRSRWAWTTSSRHLVSLAALDLYSGVSASDFAWAMRISLYLAALQRPLQNVWRKLVHYKKTITVHNFQGKSGHCKMQTILFILAQKGVIHSISV